MPYNGYMDICHIVEAVLPLLSWQSAFAIHTGLPLLRLDVPLVVININDDDLIMPSAYAELYTQGKDKSLIRGGSLSQTDKREVLQV